MKKNIISIVFAAVALLFAGTSCVKEFDTELNHTLSPDTDVTEWLPVVEHGAVKLGSFNVLYGAYNESDNYKWATRKTALAQAIVAGDFDILGVQEADKTIRTQLPALVNEARPEGSTRNYQWWLTNRDRQDADSEAAVAAVGEGVGIMYDANKFTLSEKHYFWFSTTPDVMSTGWDETNYRRQAICCIVTQNDDPTKQFFLMVTHAPLAATARLNAVTIMNERAQLYNPGNLAAFIVGDMNAAPDDNATKTFDAFGWKDAFKEVPAASQSGGVITFHSKKDITDTSNAENRIDYIYYKNKPAVLTYGVDYNKYNGYYPSDHCAVAITFNIPDPEKPVPAGVSGEGTEANPFKLTSAADWAAVAAFVNANGEAAEGYNYTLTADLTFSGDFVRINTFYGILDGAGHSMKNITSEAAAEDFGGIINVLPDGGVVKDLYVEATLSSAFKNLGGVVGKAMEGSLIDGVTFKGDLTGTADCSRIGGIVGTGYGTIANCGCLGGNFLAGSATKSENMGGIAGRIENASGATRPSVMVNCYSWLDKIISSQNNIGGVTGGLGSAAYCANVYGITADITAGGTYGGCIGYSKIGNIRNVYTTEEAAFAGTVEHKWVANDKEASDWLTTGASLPLANMKSGAVTLPSSGVSYASFVEALNAGAVDWNALESIEAMKGKDVKPYGVLNKPDVALREWEADATTGLPIVKRVKGVTPPTPGGDPIAEEIVFKTYAEEHNWTVDASSGQKVYTTVQQGVVTLTAGGNDGTENGIYNDPSYYDWRFYQARGGKLTVEVPEGYSLVSVTFTNHEYKNGGCFYDANGNAGEDGVELTVSGRTAVFTVGSKTGATNGQARITGITVKYLAPTTPDPDPDPATPTVVSVNIRQYAGNHSDVWTDSGGGTAYTIVENGITLTPNTTGSPNGVWYAGTDPTPDDWRIYQARGGFTLSVASGHTLVKATFTFTYKGTNVAKLHYNNADYATGVEIPLSGESAEFTVTSDAGGGQARISEFVVEYL